MAVVRVNRTVQRFSSGSQETPRMVLLHTTEGGGWPSYGGGSSAPHATIKPLPGVGIEVREHLSFFQYAKALVNKPGGVQTNTSGVLQFELMGTCNESATGMYFWPKADAVVLEALASYLRPIMKTYGIPVTCDVTFKAYNSGRVPSSYGLSNGVRMSNFKWNSYKGICGHQHVPENDHGDPGNFPVAELIRLIDGSGTTTTEEMFTVSQYDELMAKLNGMDKDLKEVKTGVTHMPARVWSFRLDTPKSVLKIFPWFNKTYSAGGMQGYNLFSFSQSSEHRAILDAIKAEQEK